MGRRLAAAQFSASTYAESRVELDAFERRWEGIVERLGEENFLDFLRMPWNNWRTVVWQSELFKTIRHRV